MTCRHEKGSNSKDVQIHMNISKQVFTGQAITDFLSKVFNQSVKIDTRFILKWPPPWPTKTLKMFQPENLVQLYR